MSGILDALSSFFKEKIEVANLKQCTKCWWSGYAGKVCSNATPTPTQISTINQAQTCANYTTDSPTALAVHNETPQIAYEQTDNISRGGDNTQVLTTRSGAYELLKTVILTNTSLTNSLNKITYLAWCEDHADPAFSIKITVQGSGTENIEVQEAPTNTTKSVILSQEYTDPMVTIRVYGKDGGATWRVFNTTLQAYGTDKTTVIYQ